MPRPPPHRHLLAQTRQMQTHIVRTSPARGRITARLEVHLPEPASLQLTDQEIQLSPVRAPIGRDDGIALERPARGRRRRGLVQRERLVRCRLGGGDGEVQAAVGALDRARVDVEVLAAGFWAQDDEGCWARGTKKISDEW